MAENVAFSLISPCISGHGLPFDFCQQFQPRCQVTIRTRSTYCYLLSLEEHRDADTWGVRLLELVDQGFNPDATVADAGAGLRAGQALALPEVPCRGDIFHVLRDLEQLVGFLDNRAYEALHGTERCRRQRETAQRYDRRGRAESISGASRRLNLARASSDEAISLADDVALLVRWLRHDILTVAGPSYAERRALYDFVVAELKSRVPLCPHRLGLVCRQLENEQDDLLAFARVLDEELERLGHASSATTSSPQASKGKPTNCWNLGSFVKFRYSTPG